MLIVSSGCNFFEPEYSESSVHDVKKSKCNFNFNKIVYRDILFPNEQTPINYSLRHIALGPKQKVPAHYMKNTETYYVIKGSGTMEVGEKKIELNSGLTIFVPPYSKQSIYNNSTANLYLLVIDEPAWEQEKQIILDK
jgi:mannose-6-phosphate isomerase-like protein (cupin superfamily)